ncbi:MAG: hypothetical protein ACJAT7_002307, partial [Psychromonas sp.]
MALPSLTQEQVLKIETFIMTWKSKLTWAFLVARIENDLDIKTTRQTLTTYAPIKGAYTIQKQKLRGKPS